MSDPENEGFIERWSRRKADVETSDGATRGGLQRKTDEVVRGRMITEPLPVAVREDVPDVDVAKTDDASVDGCVIADDGAHAEVGKNEPEDTDTTLEELETIDIDALGYDADFTRFMKPGVPERLRQRALQRLWQTNPVLANVDGLNDYDEDFSDAALAVDVIQSAYKVGQGYLSDTEVAERDAERAAEDGVAAAEAADDVETVALSEAPATATESDQADTAVADSDAEDADGEVIALDVDAPPPERT